MSNPEREASWQELSAAAQSLNAKIFALDQEMIAFIELVKSQSGLYEKYPFNKLHNLDLPIFQIMDSGTISATSLHQFRMYQNSGNITASVRV